MEYEIYEVDTGFTVAEFFAVGLFITFVVTIIYLLIKVLKKCIKVLYK